MEELLSYYTEHIDSIVAHRAKAIYNWLSTGDTYWQETITFWDEELQEWEEMAREELVFIV